MKSWIAWRSCGENSHKSNPLVLGDPDEGLELRDDIKVKMQQSLAAVKAGAKIIPAEEVAARLGLTW